MMKETSAGELMKLKAHYRDMLKRIVSILLFPSQTILTFEHSIQNERKVKSTNYTQMMSKQKNNT